jgi:hypothetical protein
MYLAPARGSLREGTSGGRQVTGCIGFVGHKTSLRRLVRPVAERHPWDA